MTETYKRKLIEVALPLEAINAACKKDKDRKTGTIRTLHKWFAPMPVPALRALIFASLVDDPGSDVERSRLLKMIEDLVASVVDDPPADVLASAREEIARGAGPELPTVLDPFCGAGSTLVEAQRLGLIGHGSDLNPIPVLIAKTLTEFPPLVWNRPPLCGETRLESSGLEGFFEDVRHYAARVYDAARSRLGELYSPGPNGDPIIAWWWARTVPSPDPRYKGCPVPLVNGWWLSKKEGALAYVVPVIDDSTHAIRFELRHDGHPDEHDRMRCLLSGAPISFDYVKEQGHDGALGQQLIALVTHGAQGRQHFIARDVDEFAASQARPSDVSDIPLPESALGFTVQLYGLRHWNDLFTARQRAALEVFSDLVAQVPSWVHEDRGDIDYGRAIAAHLGLSIGKMAQHHSTLVRWKLDSRNGSGKAEAAFSQQVISMSWDFIETNPFGGSVGDWLQIVETSLSALKYVSPTGPPASVTQGDARRVPAELAGKCLVVTDPPYFSAIGYANLADYFYPWVRRALKDVYPDLFSTLAGPKNGELIAEPARHESKDDAKAYFIEGFTQVFHGLRIASRSDLPTLIVYAFKEQEAESESGVSAGWEAILEAAIGADLTIVGTWPIHGAGSTRMRGLGSNALATYVVLVCRALPVTAVRCTRREFVAELRAELAESVRLMQSAAVAPVDMAQAVIGPGMRIFTRHSTVIEASGEPMTVRAALLMINAVLDEILAEQEGEYDPETRWAVTWFSQHAFGEASSGEADALARAKVTSIDGLERAGITSSRSGKTRLLRRDELPARYDPRSDATPTVWEAVQHLVRALDTDGELGAAELISLIADPNAARELTYRLYSICERKGWAAEGQAYNALAISWLEILERAEERPGFGMQQALEV
jgi:putative DNA methylase